MPRKNRSDPDFGIAVLDIFKSAGKSFLSGLGRLLLIALTGGIIGGALGGGVALYNGWAFLLSAGIGFIAGVVIVLAILILAHAEF